MPAAALRIVLDAVAVAALLFGCVGLWLMAKDNISAPATEDVWIVIRTCYGVGLASALAVCAVRAVRATMQPPVPRTLLVVVWSLAEGTVMFVAVVLVLVGHPLPWFVGMGLFGLVWAKIWVEQQPKQKKHDTSRKPAV